MHKLAQTLTHLLLSKKNDTHTLKNETKRVAFHKDMNNSIDLASWYVLKMYFIWKKYKKINNF